MLFRSPVTGMQGSSLPAGQQEGNTSGKKEEVSAHQERRQLGLSAGLSRAASAAPGCPPVTGAGRVQAAARWTEAPAGVRGGRHMGPSGHRSLLRVWQGPSGGMSQILPSSEAVRSDCLFPLVTAVSAGLWVSGLPSTYMSGRVILLFQK